MLLALLWSVYLIYPTLTNADQIYFVSQRGIDTVESDGVSNHWRSIGYALSRLPETGGVIIQAASGNYPNISITQRFKKPVIIRTAEIHSAIISAASGHGAVLLNGVKNVIFDGFVIDNRSNPSASNALHILGGCSDITVRNCIITHGNSGYRNADAVKINRDAHHILLEENIIHSSMDELVELNERVHDIILRRNILFQTKTDKQKPIMAIQDYAWNITLDGNLFVNKSTKNDNCAIRLGRSAAMARDVNDITIINNTFALAPTQFVLDLMSGDNIRCTNNVASGHIISTQQNASDKVYQVDNLTSVSNIMQLIDKEFPLTQDFLSSPLMR